MFRNFLICCAGAALSVLAQSSAGLSEQQEAALSKMTADLAPQADAVAKARVELTKAAYGDPRPDTNALRAKVEAEGAAELALARARADSFTALQGSAAKLAPDQVAGLVRAGGVYRPPGGVPHYASGGTIPNISQAQVDALTRLSTDLMPLSRAVTSARSSLVAASYGRAPR